MSVLQTILVFVVPTVGGYLLIALLAAAPRLRRKQRYRTGEPWNYEPLWWTANPEGAHLASVASHPTSAERGGARGSW